jgi:predicted Zn-dependent peptidase
MSINLSTEHSLHQRTIHRAVLNNGLVILAVENLAADIVSARILVRAGGRYEHAEQAGISHLLSTVLTKGTNQLSSQDIAERVESVGASMGADSASDYCLLSLKTVSGDFSNMLHLAAEVLRSPAFPESEVALEQRLTLQSIRSMQEQPFSVAYHQLRQIMYPGHPYALSSLGTEETVSQLTRHDLIAYHQAYFRPENVVISVAGRIIPEEAIALVDQIFGDWNVSSSPADGKGGDATAAQALFRHDAKRAATIQETQQAIIMVGHLAPSVQEDAYMTLKLLNTYLGNGLSSRLFVELREKRGLAYDVSALYPTRIDPSHFVTYIGTAPNNTAIALDSLQLEMKRLCQVILADEELQAAKNKLLGQYALGKQTNAQLAQLYGWYEILGLGVEFDQQFQQAVAAVTAESAQDIAQKYFDREPFVSLVGPSNAVSCLADPVASS